MKSIYVSCWASLEEAAAEEVEVLLLTNQGGRGSCRRHSRCPTLAAVAVFVAAEDGQT